MANDESGCCNAKRLQSFVSPSLKEGKLSSET